MIHVTLCDVSQYRWTALISASIEGRLGIVNALLAAGAGIEAKDNVSCALVECVAYLLGGRDYAIIMFIMCSQGRLL